MPGYKNEEQTGMYEGTVASGGDEGDRSGAKQVYGFFLPQYDTGVIVCMYVDLYV